MSFTCVKPHPLLMAGELISREQASWILWQSAGDLGHQQACTFNAATTVRDAIAPQLKASNQPPLFGSCTCVQVTGCQLKSGGSRVYVSQYKVKMGPAGLPGPASSLCFKRRVATSCASCTASIPLIPLPEFSTVTVYASDICLAAAVRTEKQPGAGIPACCACSAGRPSTVLLDCRQTWGNSVELCFQSILGYLLKKRWPTYVKFTGKNKNYTCGRKKLYLSTAMFCAKLQWFCKESTHLCIPLLFSLACVLMRV